MPCQLPPKELDPGGFTLPCSINNFNLYAMADLGASVNIMPKLMFEKLKLVEIKKTNMLVEITDMTKRTPLGRVENILVKVNKFLFSSNFAIIDMVAKGNETVILGRPFLAAIHAKIDVFAREITIGTGVKGYDVNMKESCKRTNNEAEPSDMEKTTDI
ncbi:putative ribonuclease H-like domain-containing protein [Tanacetum coccineum]